MAADSGSPPVSKRTLAISAITGFAWKGGKGLRFVIFSYRSKGGYIAGPPPPPPPDTAGAATASTASLTLSLPAPHVSRVPPVGAGRAVAWRCCRICNLVNLGFFCSISAIAPATCGTAMLVPVKSW